LLSTIRKPALEGISRVNKRAAALAPRPGRRRRHASTGTHRAIHGLGWPAPAQDGNSAGWPGASTTVARLAINRRLTACPKPARWASFQGVSPDRLPRRQHGTSRAWASYPGNAAEAAILNGKKKKSRRGPHGSGQGIGRARLPPSRGGRRELTTETQRHREDSREKEGNRPRCFPLSFPSLLFSSLGLCASVVSSLPQLGRSLALPEKWPYPTSPRQSSRPSSSSRSRRRTRHLAP
jgi:hypothetical protein